MNGQKHDHLTALQRSTCTFLQRFMYSRGRLSERDRERESSSIYLFTLQMAIMARARENQSQELRIPSGSLTNVEGVRSFGPFSTTFPDTLAVPGLQAEHRALQLVSTLDAVVV